MAIEVHTKAKHACRSMILVTTTTVLIIKVSQDVREVGISDGNQWVGAKRVDHGYDQRRRFGIWMFAIIFGDGCISIMPDLDSSGKWLRSEPVVVGMLNWAVSRYTGAVPCLSMLL